MKKFLVFLCAVTLVFGVVGIAGAYTIIDLFGDKDGFGIGVLPDQSFDWTAVVAEPDDEGFTDTWVYGDQTWTQIYDISHLATITSAQLEVFTGGQGWYGTSMLYVDGQYVGDLTDGDTWEPVGANYARLDIFDLSPWLTFIDGSESITVDTVLPGDGWVLDYSELTIEGAPVPEPATMLLLGFGLIGLALGRKKFFRKGR